MVNHKETIASNGLARIEQTLWWAGDTVKFTQHCWFHLVIHFALCGAKIQAKLVKSDSVF